MLKWKVISEINADMFENYTLVGGCTVGLSCLLQTSSRGSPERDGEERQRTSDCPLSLIASSLLLLSTTYTCSHRTLLVNLQPLPGFLSLHCNNYVKFCVYSSRFYLPKNSYCFQEGFCLIKGQISHRDLRLGACRHSICPSTFGSAHCHPIPGN